jgi:hypothetical protein
MVMLSTVSSEKVYEVIGSEADGSDESNQGEWQAVCGVEARPLKILLTKDLSETTGNPDHQDGANVDAWLDGAGNVFVLIDDGADICHLEPEEFEALKTVSIVPIEDEEEEGDAADANTAPTWEAEALARIKAARERVAIKETRYLRCKEDAKDAKTAWEAAVEELTECIDAATEELPLFDQQKTAAPVTQEQPGGADGESADTDDADAATRDRWRAIPIDEIFTGIKGLGAKKREAIHDAIPTLGDFEDLRAKASLAGNPLREYMPPGIGEAACDQLEEAALNRISREYDLDEDGE